MGLGAVFIAYNDHDRGVQDVNGFPNTVTTVTDNVKEVSPILSIIITI